MRNGRALLARCQEIPRFRQDGLIDEGRDRFDRGNWENRLFTRFVEAFEITDDLDWISIPPLGSSPPGTTNHEPRTKNKKQYHRTPRRDREIVIANLPEFGAATDGTG